MDSLDNPQLRLAFDFVEFTGTNVFLTGKAGTGKTTFLHDLKKKSPKRMIVVAPTGVAAINASGVTIHSFFQLPFGLHLPHQTIADTESGPHEYGRNIQRFSRNKINIIKSLDLLVIDEISMVRADLLDGIDEVLRRFRDRNKPFGGVQLLMIGDLQQLAPVVKDDEWRILKDHYETVFFFSSKALRETQQVTIELKHIYRQSDADFIDLLNMVRENKLDAENLGKLNKRYLPDFVRTHHEGYITLTTHNFQATEINHSRLIALNGEEHTFIASVQGDFPEYSFPTDYTLTLKKGAQVMFVKNDSAPEKLYYNGKIGKVVDIRDGIVSVQCAGDAQPINVESVEWQNTRYALDEKTKEIQETVAGTFLQYPLKLAWAITIHKSQGLTFEKAVIDAGAAFAHGQVYVALSRCKTIEGMVLSTPISSHCIKSDATVSRFVRSIELSQPGQDVLDESKRVYEKSLLRELFNFDLLQHQLYFCIKLANEHSASFHAGFRDELEKMNMTFRAEVTDIAQKFDVELQQHFIHPSMVEENGSLQNRVTKACSYFLPKTDSVLSGIMDLDIETDNKAALKIVKNALDRLREAATVKTCCLKACERKFTIKSFLDARAVAVVEKPEIKLKTTFQKNGEALSGTSPHPELFSTLKAWRNSKADELDIPVYMIVQQKTMLAISTSLPSTSSELLEIKGLGKRKLEQFGDEILAMVIAYREENHITDTQAPTATPDIVNKEQKAKREKTDTKKTSLEMHLSGKSIPEIATLRGMAMTTIEGHLAHFVATGELSVDQFVSPDKIFKIMEYFLSHEHRLTPAKEALGDAVSYGELRLVLSHMQAAGKIIAE
jgi:hypothetical protein